jgi:hypothetical protein
LRERGLGRAVVERQNRNGVNLGRKAAARETIASPEEGSTKADQEARDQAETGQMAGSR